MIRTYFKLIEKAIEVASLANSLAMNANFRPDVDEDTRRYLNEYMEAIEHARSVMFLAVSRQMSHDPQERDIDISIRKDYEVHDSHRHQ